MLLRGTWGPLGYCTHLFHCVSFSAKGYTVEKTFMHGVALLHAHCIHLLSSLSWDSQSMKCEIHEIQVP